MEVDIKASHLFCIAAGIIFMWLLHAGSISNELWALFFVISLFAAAISGMWLLLVHFG